MAVAKHKEIAKVEEKKEVAIAKEAGNLAEIYSSMEDDANKDSGFENVDIQKDCALPFLMILQSTSPKIQSVPGAAAGNFLNTVTGELYKGAIEVIPCAFKHALVEWKLRENGGGFVAQHENDLLLAKCKKDSLGRDITPNNTHLVATAYHFVLLLKPDGGYERVIEGFTSTQLKKSRNWMTQMLAQQVRLPNGQLKRPPMYANVFTQSTILEKNSKGSWFGWVTGKPQLLQDANLYQAAKAFHADIKAGAVKAVPPQPENEDVAGEPVGSQNVM